MSLQFRVLASIAAALFLALLLGGLLLGWHARSSMKAEIDTALRGARDVVRDTLKSDVQHTVTMRQIIASFNDQRHVRAALINEAGRAVATSRTAAPIEPAPDWFTALVAPPAQTVRIPIALPRYPCTLLLTSDPRNEAGEVWDYVRDAFLTMALFCAATLLLVWLIVGRSLRFFPRFQSGLKTVSDGGYAARLEAGGPPEFAALAHGFNHMAEKLSGYRQSNRRLQQQILTLQEEERADLARDLHDEVGPYLFAIQVDADAISRQGPEPARERADAIREAALHIQRHVKAILRQLRPANGLDFGLETALGDLVAFWQRRHPDIRFLRDVAAGLTLDRRSEETIYRIVQESVSNAVRHGSPHLIHIAIVDSLEGVSVVVADDGTGLRTDGGGEGLGLTGMAERVRALNGRFTVENSGGVRVRVLLPHTAVREKESA